MPEEDVEKFLERARLLRDYAVYSGLSAGADLIDALKEFDTNPDFRDAGALATLRRATQKACLAIEPYTRMQVLNGRSPIRFGRQRSWMTRLGFSGLVIVLIGMMLLGSALHYTKWTTRAEVALYGIDELGRTDHSKLLRDFAEQAVLIQSELQSVADKPALGREALEDFIETIDELKFLDVRQNSLLVEVNTLITDHSLIAGKVGALRKWTKDLAGYFGLGEDGTEDTAAATRGDGQAEQDQQAGAQIAHTLERIDALGKSVSRTLDALSAEPAYQQGAAPQGLSVLQQELSALNNSVHELQVKVSGEPFDSDALDAANAHFQSYVQLLSEWRKRIGFYDDQTDPERAKAAFQSRRQDLAGLLDLTNRWTFPVIYGALGAVIFSLSRHLNAVISSPPLESTILRVLFAMFIAISVSMIFIPSSAFSVGNEISPTFVFLVCFVFGYSIDSFLRLLRRVDAWVSEKVSAGSKEPSDS